MYLGTHVKPLERNPTELRRHQPGPESPKCTGRFPWLGSYRPKCLERPLQPITVSPSSFQFTPGAASPSSLPYHSIPRTAFIPPRPLTTRVGWPVEDDG